MAFVAELAALDAEFTDGLVDCESDVIVTSHRAFEYLARAYGLGHRPPSPALLTCGLPPG